MMILHGTASSPDRRISSSHSMSIVRTISEYQASIGVSTSVGHDFGSSDHANASFAHFCNLSGREASIARICFMDEIDSASVIPLELMKIRWTLPPFALSIFTVISAGSKEQAA